MAFRLVTEDSYAWPVQVDVPQDGGAFRSLKFRARFAYLEQDEIAELTNQGDEALLERVLRGWEGFIDVAGQAIDYDDENRAQAIRTPFVRIGLVRGFFESLAGKQSRRKNF